MMRPWHSHHGLLTSEKKKSIKTDAHMFIVPTAVAKVAVEQLARVDYSVATRLSHGAAQFVPWAIDHEWYALADLCMLALQRLDEFGNELISITTWLVLNCHANQHP